MNRNIVFFGLFLVSFLSFGQESEKKSIEDFEKVYYHDKTVTQDDFDILVKNIIDYKDILKFALKVTNKSNCFIVYDKGKSKFIIDGKTLPANSKTKLISVSNSKTQTIDTDRSGLKKLESFGFLLDGLFILKEKEPSIEVVTFEIPMSKKDFSFGDVTCIVSIPVRKSQKMTVKIAMNNKGKDYIVVQPFRVGLKMPDGKIYTSKNVKEIIVLAPQSKKNMTLKWDRMPKGNLNDMQKVDMNLIFNEVFFYTEKTKLDPLTVNLIWDEKLTDEKK